MPEVVRTFRADILSEQHPQDYLKLLDERIQQGAITEVLLFRENAKKTHKDHIQGFIKFSTASDMQNFRVYIRTKFKYTKGQYSIADIKNLEAYERYISKDGNIFFQHGIDEARVQDLLQQTDPFSLNVKRKSKIVFADLCLEAVKQKMKSIEPTGRVYYDMDRSKIIRTIMQTYKEHKKVFDDYVIRRMTQYCEYCLEDDNTEYMYTKVEADTIERVCYQLTRPKW